MHNIQYWLNAYWLIVKKKKKLIASKRQILFSPQLILRVENSHNLCDVISKLTNTVFYSISSHQKRPGLPQDAN